MLFWEKSKALSRTVVGSETLCAQSSSLRWPGDDYNSGCREVNQVYRLRITTDGYRPSPLGLSQSCYDLPHCPITRAITCHCGVSMAELVTQHDSSRARHVCQHGSRAA